MTIKTLITDVNSIYFMAVSLSMTENSNDKLIYEGMAESFSLWDDLGYHCNAGSLLSNSMLPHSGGLCCGPD